MPARPPKTILDTFVKGTGKSARFRRQLTAGRERNWLLALTHHSFAKFADNANLSDLEQSIVTAFKDNGFTDAEIREQGELAKALPSKVRSEIFPAKFAKLTVSDQYSTSDLKRDSKAIIKATVHRPNVMKVDMEAIHDGRAVLADFRIPSRQASEEDGFAMTVALLSNVTPPNPRYRIRAESFHCIDRDTDSVFGPSNEPYWIFGSLGGGTAVTTRSSTFGDVDNGESRTFNATEGCIWGQNCAPDDLPDGEIGTLIQLWEHDEGNQEKVRAAVAAAFAAAGGILIASGVAAWIGAVVAGVGAVVAWLLGFLDDDHIADQTFVFTRQAVENMFSKTSSTSIVRKFANGDANYDLKIRLTRFA